MIQLIIIITSKASKDTMVHLAVLLVAGRLMLYVHNDTQVVMKEADVIFRSRNGKQSLLSAESAMLMESMKNGISDDDLSDGKEETKED